MVIENTINVYTDGSSLSRPRRGGIGIHLVIINSSGQEEIKDSVMASDGFFPFPDAVEIAAEAGVSAILSPSGSLKDALVIQRANELGVALFHAPERIFSHH